MRTCQYDDCGADLTGYPPASKYCTAAHAALAKREQEAAYARRNRPLINRRRRNREAKKAREEAGFKVPDVPEVPLGELDDGRTRPPLIDGVLRVQGPEYTGSGDPDEVDDLPWMIERDPRVVDFHPARSEPRRYDHLGRPYRDRPARGSGQLVNPAAEGLAVVRSPASAQQALRAQQGQRFGPNVREPVQVVAAHLAAPPDSMLQAEAQAAEDRRSEADHLRGLMLGRRR